jgi:hypothetical protein
MQDALYDSWLALLAGVVTQALRDAARGGKLGAAADEWLQNFAGEVIDGIDRQERRRRTANRRRRNDNFHPENGLF